MFCFSFVYLSRSIRRLLKGLLRSSRLLQRTTMPLSAPALSSSPSSSFTSSSETPTDRLCWRFKHMYVSTEWPKVYRSTGHHSVHLSDLFAMVNTKSFVNSATRRSLSCDWLEIHGMILLYLYFSSHFRLAHSREMKIDLNNFISHLRYVTWRSSLHEISSRISRCSFWIISIRKSDSIRHFHTSSLYWTVFIIKAGMERVFAWCSRRWMLAWQPW